MNKTITLIIFVTVFGLFGCNLITEKKNLKNIQESYDAFSNEQSRISQLMIENPDTALIVLNEYINKYPENIDFLSLRASLYFELEDYRSCRGDIELILHSRPDTKMIWDKMLKYLDCKIDTKNNNCDSILVGNNVYEIELD